MNIRWLWGNYIEPEWKLSRAEVREVHRIVRQRHVRPGLVSGLTLAWLVIAFLAVWLLSDLAGGLMARLGLPHPMSWVTGRLLVILPLMVLALWTYRYLYTRPVRMAMRELGYDVCPSCGYWLRGLGEQVKRCPECGAAREAMPARESVSPEGQVEESDQPLRDDRSAGLAENSRMTVASEAAAPPQLLDRCMNCGAELAGRYCASCGQDHRHRRLSAAELLHNAIEAVFSLESPMWRTVVSMLWKPGRVAAEYVSGMRRRYVSPLKFCFACGALAAIVVQMLAVFGEGRTGGLAAPEMADEVRAVWEWFARWFHIVYFLSLPLLAALLRAANRHGGRTFLESLVLCLFVYGQVFLLQTPLIALSEFVHTPAWGYLSSAIGLAYLSWGAAQFYKGRAWLIALTALLMHLVHSAIVLTVVMVVGLVLQRVLG